MFQDVCHYGSRMEWIDRDVRTLFLCRLENVRRGKSQDFNITAGEDFWLEWKQEEELPEGGGQAPWRAECLPILTGRTPSSWNNWWEMSMNEYRNKQSWWKEIGNLSAWARIRWAKSTWVDRWSYRTESLLCTGGHGTLRRWSRSDPQSQWLLLCVSFCLGEGLSRENALLDQHHHPLTDLSIHMFWKEPLEWKWEKNEEWCPIPIWLVANWSSIPSLESWKGQENTPALFLKGKDQGKVHFSLVASICYQI